MLDFQVMAGKRTEGCQLWVLRLYLVGQLSFNDSKINSLKTYHCVLRAELSSAEHAGVQPRRLKRLSCVGGLDGSVRLRRALVKSHCDSGYLE